MTKLIDITNLNRNKINKILTALKQGKIIAYPTDTIHGLGVDTKKSSAGKKLFQLKKRNSNNPVSILYPGIDKLLSDFSNLNKYQKNIVKRLLPGSVTLILPVPDKLEIASYFMENGWSGVRVIVHKKMNKILSNYPNPISTTSINPHNKPPAKNLKEIKDYFDDDISLILDDRQKGKDRPSTILKVNKDSYNIVRKGAVSKKQIEDTIN